MRLYISIEKTFQGAWKLSAMIKDQLIQRQYHGYTKEEALKLFKQFIKEN
jgi:hypothetical protein